MNQTNQRVAKAAGLLMVATTLSRILGFVRERGIAQIFGRTRLTDIFFAAFSIPDLMYYLLIGGALSAAFIPVFTSYLANNKEKEGWYVASTFINVTVLLLFAFTILGIIFAPRLAPLVAYNFTGRDLQLLVRQMRFMFPAVFFTALAGLQMGILNSYQVFGPPAFGPIVYNLAIIAACYLLGPSMSLTGLAIGVVVGAIGNFFVQFPFVRAYNKGYQFVMDFSHPGIRKIFKLMVPSLLGLSVTQINLIINQSLASGLAAGSITALRYANRLMQLPLGIFAMGISTAIFPTLARQASRREMDDFRATFSLGLRSVFFITVPAGIGLWVLGEPIVRLLFQGAEFTAADTKATAFALGFYSLGLFAQSGIQVITRVYYSLNDTVTPVLTGLATVVLNVLLNLFFLSQTNLAHGGLALAFSISGIFNFFALVFFLRRKIGAMGGGKIAWSFMKTAIASLGMGLGVIWATGLIQPKVNLSSTLGQLIEVGGGIAVGLLVYFVAAYLMGMEELELVLDLVKKKIKRRK
ncbi:MAG: murein biosynthesis integral membrane protein MurJ [Firmicutes bacterium]|jgi:putative peptidoglycan lipid II flippase|nr:murein biosynthesis integral membrane protein MurJ [Bacillota bacterium]HQD40175.1 murein biosynthesis integral membrane protein MurJ [Bacillota bacterium]